MVEKDVFRVNIRLDNDEWGAEGSLFFALPYLRFGAIPTFALASNVLT